MKFKSIILLALFAVSVGKRDSVHAMDKIPDKIKKEIVWIVKNNKLPLFLMICFKGGFAYLDYLDAPKAQPEDVIIKVFKQGLRLFLLNLVILKNGKPQSYYDLFLLLYAAYSAYLILKNSISFHFLQDNQDLPEALMKLTGTDLNVMVPHNNPNGIIQVPLLTHAIISKKVKLFNKLIFEKRIINLNLVDSQYKRTPLLWALAGLNHLHIDDWSKQNHKYFIKMLLLAGADPEIKDKDGKTFFDYVNEIQNEKLRTEIQTMKEFEEKVLAPKRKQIADEIFEATQDNGILYDISKIIAGYCL